MQTMFEATERLKGDTSEHEASFKVSHVELNRIYCLGYLGKLVYQVLKTELGKLQDICVIAELPIKKLIAMGEGNVLEYSLEDIQQACKACYWQLVCSWTDCNYKAVLRTPSKVYKLNDTWNSDQAEIEAIIKRNSVPNVARNFKQADRY